MGQRHVEQYARSPATVVAGTTTDEDEEDDGEDDDYDDDADGDRKLEGTNQGNIAARKQITDDGSA